jgi:hypothetical protein
LLQNCGLRCRMFICNDHPRFPVPVDSFIITTYGTMTLFIE